jgi:small conductance mechanosensitive channel
MKILRLLTLLALLPAVSVFAQEPPPLPSAPYAVEDVAALRIHLAAAETKLAKTQDDLDRAREAAGAPGIDAEEKSRRQAEVARLEGIVTSTDAHINDLNARVTTAAGGPTRDALDARREYDRLATLASRVASDLAALPDGGVEGGHAKAIRESLEELARIARLADEAHEFTFQSSRVFEHLSELEKLDHELRWADQRLKLKIDEYDHLLGAVFTAYVEYEERAFEGLRAVQRARHDLYPRFRDTPAETLKLNGTPRAVTDLDKWGKQINEHLRRRRGLAGTPQDMQITVLNGRLRAIQEEIDTREDFRERLEAEAARLKDVLAAAAPADSNGKTEDAPADTSEVSEYRKLSDRIDRLERDLADLRRQASDIEEERIGVDEIVAGKRTNDEQVKALVDETERKLKDLQASYVLPENPTPPEREAFAEKDRFKPVIRLFVLAEELAAQNERLNASRRDSRQALSQVEFLDRRTERINEQIAAIEEHQLPDLRERYYLEIGKTVGLRAIVVVAVFAAAWFLVFLTRVIGTPLIEGIVRRADKRRKTTNADEQQRARTLMTVFMTTVRVVIYITAVLFAVAQFDVDYGPLLVAAGGVSLAVGFGAQTLVRDFFAGFFILLEGQFSIGDVVEINGKVGTVENLNLRTTVLRSLNGDVHVIPNGEIKMTSNQTKLWSRWIIDVGVAYEENTDDVAAIMEAVAAEMRDDETWSRKLLEHVMMGVHKFDNSAVVMRLLLKTRAGEQWGVSREYQRRLKLKFDELGIEIPWPQQVVSRKASIGMDAKQREQAVRTKRAGILRYVRKSRGEVTEEEAAIAGMSIEERDRAGAMANREAELAEKHPEVEEKKPDEPAPESKPEVEDDEHVSDAERLAKKMAAEQLEKDKDKGDGSKGDEDKSA